MNPLLLNFPDSFDTDRLTIRAARYEDAPEIVEAVNESLNELRPWMPWAAQSTTLEVQQSRLRHVMAAWLTREDLGLQLCLKGTQTMVGGSGLHRMDWDSGKFEIGYWCRTKFIGQGYITEAVHGITDFAFRHLKANRVEIRCDAGNERSSAVAKRCGFLLEGILRNDCRSVNGELRSTVVFSKISSNEINYNDVKTNDESPTGKLDRSGRLSLKIGPITLEGQNIRLEPLSMQHHTALCEVGLVEEIWRWTTSLVLTPDDMRTYIETALKEQSEGKALPFATIDKAANKVVGSTRFGNIDRANRRVEIGWTWINPQWQRTYINTEAKYLMLRHAFETWQCIRVELKTDSLNEKSRNAMLRIGAKEEGIFRNHMVTYSGRLRHSVYFSIIDSEWPQVKANLEAKMAR